MRTVGAGFLLLLIACLLVSGTPQKLQQQRMDEWQALEVSLRGAKPFHARLYGDTWIVKETLHPQGVLGGTAVIKLNKTDGRILFMMRQE